MKWLRNLFKPDPKLLRDKPPERPLRKDVYEHPDFTDHIKDLKTTVRKLNIGVEQLEDESGHRYVQRTALPTVYWRRINEFSGDPRTNFLEDALARGEQAE